MSTDIVALEKQYAKLRRKQHHACVVISGIKPARAEADIDKDSPVSPDGPAVLDTESQNLESSVAMLTLSVPLETEKNKQDFTDPISPTVFGDTKCFFVQNLKRKTKEKHHPKRSKKSNKSSDNLHSDEPSTSEDGNNYTAYHTVSSKKSNKKTKHVSFNDETDTIDIKKASDTAVVKDDLNEEPTIGIKDGNEICKTIKQVHDSDISESEEGNKCQMAKTGEAIELTEKGYVETNVDIESKEKDNNTMVNQNDIKVNDEFSDKVESINGSSGNESREFVEKDKLVKEEMNEKDDEEDDCKTKSDLKTNILKTSKTQGLRNPSIKYSKQYYPSHQISHRKHRTKSESAENTNKQSIYQHFNFTKRQLSLDSALTGGKIKPTQAKSIEFPFPVHMINEHKIKAGMKLGLYDHKALEKLEKTRKIPKTKLPHLTFD